MKKTNKIAIKYGIEPLYAAELLASGFCAADIQRLALKRASLLKK